MVNGHEETFPTLVLETWALTDVRTKRWKVTARKQREKLMPTTLKWKCLRLAQQRQTTKMYGSLHTRSRDLGINRCETQEKDGGGEEARVEAGACDREIAKEMAMNNTTKTNTNQDEDSFTHVPETWAVASESQCETQETEGGDELIDKVNVYNKEVDLNDVITTSNKEETNVEVVINSNTRVCHESGQSAKHEIWSNKDLEVGMHLKVLHGVVNVIIQIKPWGQRHKTKMHDGSKCLEQ